MRFELLGPVTVVAGDLRLSIPRTQTRGVLALLLLNPGRAITREAAIEAVWGGAAPSTARAQIHNAVRDIRKHLAGEVIVTERIGYRAVVDPADVDALAFEGLIKRGGDAERSGDHVAAIALLREALKLWRGEPLADVSCAFVEPTRARLVELRLTTIEDLADIELRHGRPELVAADLTPLVHAHPLRERLRIRLMGALHRSGRQAEALRVARQYRTLLAEQEGLDPGPEIVEAEAAILRSPATIAMSATTATTGVAAAAEVTAAGGAGGFGPGRPAGSVAAAWEPPRPAQLPAQPAGFVGREREIVALDQACRPDGVGARIVAIVGPGGSGKTSLAVHWAYRHLAGFDGGQLYVNLHGFGLGPRLDAFDALGQLLRGLGVGEDALPGSVDERAAQFRSLVSGRRMLIVLDNASDSAQVRPLLPGVGAHVTLITSRRRLDGLTVSEGVRQLLLDPMPDDDATGLLRRHVGPDRADDRVLAEVTRISGGLPLALRIVAARLATTPVEAIPALVADLLDERRRLAALALPTEDTAVRSAFAASYQALSGPGRRMFRLLGMLAGAEASVEACAIAAGAPVAEVRPAIEELRACHLVQRTAAGWYQTHDLTRLYARELAEREDPPGVREAAERRLIDWYLAVAYAADGLLRPHRSFTFPVKTDFPVAMPTFADVTAVLAWYDAEAAGLLAAVERAEQLDPTACWQLVAVLYCWLERHQRRTAWIPVCEAGARSATVTGDREAIALIETTLAIFHCHLQRFDEGAEAFRRVLAVRRELGVPRDIATTLMNLGNVYVETGRDAEAMPCLLEAVALFEQSPDTRVLLGATYDNIGWAHRSAGRYDEAIEWHTRAGEMGRECDDVQTVAYAEGNLATVLADCGRYEVSLRHWGEAIEYARRSGDLRLVADGFLGRGKARIELGEQVAGRDDLTEALVLYQQIGSDRADDLVDLLHSGA